MFSNYLEPAANLLSSEFGEYIKKYYSRELNNLFAFFPEEILSGELTQEEVDEVLKKQTSLMNKIQGQSLNIILEDNVLMNSLVENGHVLIFQYCDLPIFFGTKEDLDYFLTVY